MTDKSEENAEFLFNKLQEIKERKAMLPFPKCEDCQHEDRGRPICSECRIHKDKPYFKKRRPN